MSSEIFTTLAEAQLLCARWRSDYNHRRPRRALGKQTPVEYAAKCEVPAARRLVQRMETTGNTRKSASIMKVPTLNVCPFGVRVIWDTDTSKSMQERISRTDDFYKSVMMESL